MRLPFQRSCLCFGGILILWASQGVLSIDITDRDKIVHDKGVFIETNTDHTKYYADNNAVDQNFFEEATEEVTNRVKVFLNIEDEDVYAAGNPYLRHKSHKKSSKKSKSKKSKRSRKPQTDTGSRSNPNCDSASSSGSLDLSISSDQVRCSADEGENLINPSQPSSNDESIDQPPPTTPSAPVAPAAPVVPTAPTAPTTPTTPTAPIAPTTPTAPIAPTTPTAPTAPVVPTAPTPTTLPVAEITSNPSTTPTVVPNAAPSAIPSTAEPSSKPSTAEPTMSPKPTTSHPPSLGPSISSSPSLFFSEVPSNAPSTPNPTLAPTTAAPTRAPITSTSTPTTAPPPLTGPNCPSTAFINEFHYQNIFLDATEFVEIAHTSDYNLAGHIIYFYNGATGTVYKQTDDLSTILISISNEAEGTGFTFSSYTVYTPQSQVLDANAGIALVGPDNTVLDFISYGIPITATSGPAAGTTSTLVGQTEAANTGPQTSLQLGGIGYQKSDFSWQSSQLATPGNINTGQTILCPTAESVAGVNNRMGIDAAVKQITNTDFIFHKGD